ncbi:MAG: hypothetical protein GX046_10490 [Tissierellia bacterium]|nr:hypothetical protein [Tissierellia bacterium]
MKDYQKKILRLEAIEGQLSDALALDKALVLYKEAVVIYKELQQYYQQIEEDFNALHEEN